MKKNMVYMTATENGILVAVKTKLSNTEMTKIRCNEERVNNVLKDIHAELIFCEPNSKDYNFSIGSYSNGEVSMEAIHIEASNMMLAMDQLKDWLKTVPEVEEDENIQEIEKEGKPDQEEIDFVKEIKKEGPFMIKGIAMDEEGFFPISISTGCLTRMLDSYLEKYGSNG